MTLEEASKAAEEMAMALVAEVRRLKALAAYAGHTYHCALSAGGSEPCSCGFDGARK